MTKVTSVLTLTVNSSSGVLNCVFSKKFISSEDIHVYSIDEFFLDIIAKYAKYCMGFLDEDLLELLIWLH